MEFSEVVKKRRMVRNFNSEPVLVEALDRIMDLARRAPSAGYSQGQDFVVVTRPDLRQAVAEICGEAHYLTAGMDPFLSRAPVLVVACTNEAAYHRRYQQPDKLRADGTEIDWPVPFWYMDAGCAVMVLLLAVVNEGLAAGFVGVWDQEALRRLLNIPQEVTPVGVIPIGHAAPDVRSPSLKRGRRPQADVIHYETW
jgi:nitroreductase